MMKRIISLALAILVTGNFLFAQNLDQGRKFMYYERYKSAKDNFEKMIAANPNDINAVYWLGQTLIEMKDSTAAKNLYSKTLASNGNAPLLLVGIGQIELMEGKTAEARQRFETAINLSKGKDIDVLTAIGHANVKARPGDARYAVEKLTLATQVKKFNNAHTLLVLGDAYRKLIEGGNAVTSYNKALAIDSKLAAAKTKIGRVYLTQNNPEYFLPAFEEAVQLDPAYAPAYFELYYYWYFRDVNKAGQYLDKYIANTDVGPEIEYAKTDYIYAKGDFAGARTRAQQLIQQYGDKVNPRMYRMIAYTSDTLGDVTAAREAMTSFLAKAEPEVVLSADYEELARINSKIPGNEQEAFQNFQQAIDKDTAMENKVKYIQKAAALAKQLGDRTQEANWLGIAYQMDKNPNQNDLYNWGYAHYQAGNYDSSRRIFCEMYQGKYPNEIYGYLWCARSLQAMDTTMEQGLAVDAYKTLAEKAIALDSAGKYKSQAINAHFYLVSYYNDIAKDKDLAIAHVDKVLEIDPQNENALRVKDILTRPVRQPQQQAKPKTTTKKPTAKKG
jgi:tetratricopeptide (TPR) repeat protein